MTTIIMLPAPPPAGGRPAGSGTSTGSGPSGEGEFAAALGAATGAVTGDDAQAADQAPADPATGEAQAGQGAADEQATPAEDDRPVDVALVTVADLVRAASPLLDAVGGRTGELTLVDGDQAPADGDAPQRLAQVVDLARWRSGAGSSPAVPTQPVAAEDAVAAPTTSATGAAAPAPGAGPAADAAWQAAEQAAVAAPAAAGQAVTGPATPQATPAPAVPAGVAGATGTTGAEGMAATPSVAVAEPPAGPSPAAPPAAPVPARPLAEQLAPQLGVRLGALRDAGPGTHVLTMRVEPESFGPVRVVAHIGTEGVRIELLGATDAARDALRAALPDLRRDLVAAGLQGGSLDLGAPRQSGPDLGTGSGGGTDRRGPGGDDTPAAGHGTGRGGPTGRDAADTTQPDAPRTSAGRLDLLV